MTTRLPSQRGYVIMILTLLFAAIGLILVVGGAVPIVSSYAAMRGYADSSQAFLASHSAAEEALYRLRTSRNLPGTVMLTLGNASATITTTATPTGKKIIVNGAKSAYQRNLQIDLAYGTGEAFHYGIQSGEGGFSMANSSTITGNVFSNGPVTGAGNYIYGDVISAGPTGVINGIHATGTAYAHTIQSSTIDKDAYYQTISATTVGGTSHPGTGDQATTSLPITDAQIQEWENWAAGPSGSTATCSSGTYTVTSSVTIGPLYVPCDMLIKGNGIVVNIAGPIWIKGNLTTQNGPTIKMDSSLGSENVAIIADNPSNPTGSGTITIGQNTQFQNSGSVGSYVFTISGNTSAETGGAVVAFTMGQSSGALVAFAGHGLISLGQSVSIKEAAAYKIQLTNTANVTYDTGLISAIFKSGPGGGYDLTDWFEY